MIELEDLSGRTAIVTGAGQGMGRAVAEALAKRGARIAINDRRMETAEIVAAELRGKGAEVIAIVADVTDSFAVKEMIAKIIREFGGVHILVNNAGILCSTQTSDISEAEWNMVIDVNLKGTFLCSQAVLNSMRIAQWGRIVNFSSTAGKSVSTIGGPHYTAAKAGILGFTRHLAREVSRQGITVNAVCPGLIDTEMVRSTIAVERIQAYARCFPIPRLGRPEEVAELVAFLCSERAEYITGASLDINGGDLTI